MRKRGLIAFILAAVLTLTGCGAGTQNQVPSEVDGITAETNVGSESTETNTSSDSTETNVSSDTTGGADASVAILNSSMSSNHNIPLNIVDDKFRTTYEVFVYSFYDSDGDGIGDLQGLISQLDYINDGDDTTDTDLGCNEIWLMPISPSPTYHKYDITDYMDIDPQYGTLEDFDQLVKACHERGVNLIIDLVLNHTSNSHPWFKDAGQYIKDHPELTTLFSDDGKEIDALKNECPYLYYYNFANELKGGYEKLNGTTWYYEARFWSGMPDLNLDNPEVRDEISKITQFWTDRGVDGFRLDAVTSYYTDEDDKNIEFLTWLNDTIKAQNENAYIVGEAWTAMSRYSSYYVSGVDSFFDFDFSGSEGMIASVARSKKAPLLFAKAMENEENIFAQAGDSVVNAPFYTNHDMARSAGYFVGRGTDRMVKMAGALNLLMTGNAFVYYGEELGMKGSGKDENKRAPMQWGDASTSGMCKGPSDMEKFDMAYPPLSEQEQDPYSIYNYYKEAIRLRNAYPVIARGKTVPVEEISDDDLGAFLRVSDELTQDNSLLIIINNGDEEKSVDLSGVAGIGGNPELAYKLLVDENDVSLEGTSLTIPSYGIVVVK